MARLNASAEHSVRLQTKCCADVIAVKFKLRQKDECKLKGVAPSAASTGD